MFSGTLTPVTLPFLLRNDQNSCHDSLEFRFFILHVQILWHKGAFVVGLYLGGLSFAGLLGINGSLRVDENFSSVAG